MHPYDESERDVESLTSLHVVVKRRVGLEADQ
jgi:hypothetical protein